MKRWTLLVSLLVCGCVKAPSTSLPSSSTQTPSAARFVPALPSPSHTPTPTYTPPPCVLKNVVILGRVTDPNGNGIADARITGTILDAGRLFANGSDSLTVTNQIGTYYLNGAPIGVQMRITVDVPGSPQQQTLIRTVANSSSDDMCELPSPLPSAAAALKRIDFVFPPKGSP